MKRLFLMQRNDRQALLAILTVAVGAVLVLWRCGNYERADVLTVDSLTAVRPSSATSQPQPRSYALPDAAQPDRFRFDPNTADSAQLARLGLQPWQISNIYKYRSHGGIYRTKHDFARLYGLTVKQYRELEPFITISSDYAPASTLVSEAPQPADTLPRRHKLQAGETIDLNSLDTLLFQQVPGIGPYFARRIAAYGRRLGGYAHVDQLDEIDDFPAAAKPFFTVSTPPQRLAVNRLSLGELRRHPYLNYFQARAITDYRRLHGRIASLDDLSLLPDFTPEALDRLRPYVEF